MCGRQWIGRFGGRVAPAIVAVLVGGCHLPLGHRKAYVDFGFGGTLVGRPEKGSLVDRMGLRGAHQIVSINGKPVESETDLDSIAESLVLGDKVKIVTRHYGPGPPTTARFEGTVTEADVGRSSNYLVYGYEKVGDRLKRWWIHLGVIAFGDWTGARTREGDRSRGLNIDVPPERFVLAMVGFGTVHPKYFLFGVDTSFQGLSTLPHPKVPTIYYGDDDGERCVNLLWLTVRWDGGLGELSLWPVGGYIPFGEHDGFAYLTPFLSAEWRDGGLEIEGIVHYKRDIRALFPVFSVVDSDLLYGTWVPLLSLVHYNKPEKVLRVLWIPFRGK